MITTTFQLLSVTTTSACSWIHDWDRPVVAAVMGGCLGGGLELILGCNYIIACDTEKTIFSVPEGICVAFAISCITRCTTNRKTIKMPYLMAVLIGVIPGSCGTQFLTRRINVHEALTMLVTGKRLTAKEAYDLGLVNKLISYEDGVLDRMERMAIDTVIGLHTAKINYPRLNLYNSECNRE